MNTVALFSTLWKAFPLIPVLFLAIALAFKYLANRDFTAVAVRMAVASQLAAGLLLIALGLSVPELARPLTLPLSQWANGIVFRYEPVKLYFLGALLIPMSFALFHADTLRSAFFRFVFLLYLTGASGLVVTGDIFNFFVFYEVMIMAAYMLIATEGDYGASVKYMIIGSVSSALFLAATVVLYTTGAYFGFTFVDEISLYPSGNLRLAMLLFALAFFVKAAFFPASGWVASCHSAATPLISAFLAAFTIFSGIIGLYYFVLVPAELMGETRIFPLLRGVSLLTIPAAALSLFWEPQLKRAIAASTVFTIGMVGLLLSYQAYHPAFSYILVHGFYKSLLFFVYGETSERDGAIYFQPLRFAAFLLGLFFTIGLFPSVTWFLKAGFLHGHAPYKFLFALSVLLLAGGFAKFPLKLEWGRRGGRYLALSIAILALLYPLLLHAPGALGFDLTPPTLLGTAVDLCALAAGILLGRRIYQRFPACHAFDAQYIFSDLNRELFLILILAIFALFFVF